MFKVGQKVNFTSRVRYGVGAIVAKIEGPKGHFWEVKPEGDGKNVKLRISRLIKDLGPVNPSVPVNFAFGKAMMVEGNGKAEHAAVCNFIEEHLRRWNALPAVSSGFEGAQEK